MGVALFITKHAMSNANSVPEPEIYGRPVGKLQFVCPNCGQEHPLKAIAWRRADIQCQRCKSRYQLGLGFHNTKMWDAYIMGKWNSYTANRWKPIGTGYDGAKLHGTVEWACRNCSTPQKSFMNYNGMVSCVRCTADYYISLLIYRIPNVSRHKLKAPLDSIVQGLNETTSIQSISPTTPDQSPGASS